MKKVIKGDADRLALILGHELGHILERHIVTDTPGKTDLVRQVFSRKDEIAADVRGLQLTVKAGYSYRKAIKGIEAMMRLGLNIPHGSLANQWPGSGPGNRSARPCRAGRVLLPSW